MSNDEQTSTLQEQMALLQQQLQQQQQQQQYPAHQPQPVQDSGDNSLPTPRAKYEWTPSNKLVTLLDMDQNLFVGTPLTDKQLASLIDLYPPNAVLDYRPPDAVTAAYGHMNESQRSHDASLKSIQYLLSAVFRSLNLLGHQLLNARETNDIQHSLKILHDARAMLLNVSNSVNIYRNGIAIKAANKSFKTDLSGDSRHTMPSDQFHSMICQLNSTQKTIKDAQLGSKPFRSGPPSQHGGKVFNNNNNFTSTSSSNNNRFNQQRGRLRHFYHEWETVTNCSWLLNNIQHDYLIPFTQPPPLTSQSQPISPLDSDQHQLIEQSIQGLLQQKAIKEVKNSTPGFYSSIFAIPKKNKGTRLVFNLKALNQFIQAPPFKMETLSEVPHLIRKNDYLTSIDLHSAFTHIPIHPASRKYLRFNWKGKIWEYTIAPFGLNIHVHPATMVQTASVPT
ncbi:hypothetical protein G6F66_012327 [Rhizopus arrhizus]|nr:hypothetical protein G6F66_012327 [Rhizopus arrhizus]